MLARFVPIVRTFLNPVAGVLGMDARRFFLWNVIGGVVWIDALLLFGYFVGSSVENIDRYILPGVFVIVVLSFVPIVREVIKNRKSGAAQAEGAAAPAAASGHGDRPPPPPAAPPQRPPRRTRSAPAASARPRRSRDPFDAFQQAINAQIRGAALRRGPRRGPVAADRGVLPRRSTATRRPGGPYPGDARPGATYGTGAPQGDPYAGGAATGRRPYGRRRGYQGDPSAATLRGRSGVRRERRAIRALPRGRATETALPTRAAAYGGGPLLRAASSCRCRARRAGAQRPAEPDWQAWRAWQDPEHDR